MREIIDGRFKMNKIVRYLLDTHSQPVDLNLIWKLTDNNIFDIEDLKELYQLIGYSEGGYYEVFPKENN